MNISKLLAVSFCLLFLQNYLSAQDKLNIKWGKISSEDFKLPDNALIDSNANAVIIADMGYTNFVGNNNGWFSWVFKRKTRIKILNKRGISAATHEIQLYNNEEDREKTDDITGSTYNLEGSNIVETKLSKKEVFEDRLDKNHVDTKFTLPAVKEGSIIEFSYTIKSPFYYNIPSWSFQNIEFPALWSEYEVTIPTTLIYVYLKQGTDAFHVQTLTQSRANYHVTEHAENSLYGKVEEGLNVATTTNVYRWVMKDVPSLNVLRIEKYISTPKNYIDRVEFQLYKVNNGETSHDVTNTWAKANEELLKSESFGQPLRQDNYYMNQDLDAAITGSTDDLMKAKKIYYYVTHNFTCINYNNARIRTTLKEVFKKHSGCVGEINLLLAAMLRQKGIPADPVLLSTREFGTNLASYPIMERLNYVICRIKINGLVYYLDASEPLLGFGNLPANCYNGHARIISETDSGSVFFYADSIKERDNTNVVIINDEKGNPSGGFQTTPGYYKSYSIRESINKETDKAFFKNIQTSYGSDMTIGNTGVDSLDNLEQPVTYHYDFDFKNWKDQDIIYFNPMMSAAYRENPFKSFERRFLVEMPYPPDEMYTFNMEVPKGYSIEEIPKSSKVTLNGTDGFFEYIIQQSASDIQMRCHLKLNKATFSAIEYNTLRDFYGFVVKKESEQIVFKKKK